MTARWLPPVLFFLLSLSLALPGRTQNSDRQVTTLLPGQGRERLMRMLSQPIVELRDGARYTLHIKPVNHTIAGVPVRFYAYNGSVPGPLLKVRQGTTVTIDLINGGDQETTLHWHGLRLDNAPDGVPGTTQSPVPPGGTQRYTLRFADEGMYWYHPHVRADFQQDVGLYGNLWVLPANPKAYGPVDREEVLLFNNILLQDGQQVPYRRDAADHALLGRYGNVLLVNGAAQYRLKVQAGERVRFYFTNAANARPFKLALPGVRLKRVGGDSGRYEREEYVDHIVLAPSERAIVETLFTQPGSIPLINDTPDHPRELGRIDIVQGAPREETGDRLREHPDVQATVAPFKRYLNAPPDHTLILGLDMPGRTAAHGHGDSSPATPIAWEDTLGESNARQLSTATRWYLKDAATGMKNMAVHYRFQRGQPVKLRILNPATGHHPMQHPIHFHGQRLLVLAVDGKAVDNQVWKDTVLVPAGAQVDIVLDPSTPGEWLAHCHIAEHLTAGMMLGFTVTDVVAK